jgi:hypothetical protein
MVEPLLGDDLQGSAEKGIFADLTALAPYNAP